MKPKLTLLGAGPGDIELITLKGIKALAKADVILYDALVDSDILQFAPVTCKKVFVGKRAGKHSYSQEEINRLIVEHAFNYGHVVRLKGGDPFIFGRGYEELQYAETFGITVEVIPGLSSSTALTAGNKIPLTHRGVSEGFWVITGTTKSGELSNDIALAAKSRSTVVILMGLRKIKEIADIFCAEGKQHTPAMVIQSGSTDGEQIVYANVRDIAKTVKIEGVQSPAIIVIGETVGLSREIDSVILNEIGSYERKRPQ